MDSQVAASLFTVLLIGLFIGTNLGVLLMCLMRMASVNKDVHPEPEPKGVKERS